MDAMMRIEKGLAAALAQCDAEATPPLFTQALRYAVFPGGAWVRPRLCLAVAAACGADDDEVADAAAAAIELLHCASLVHDDMPCFDNAVLRRGKPSVHKAYGEPLALLVGDALIVMAFETIGRGAARHPARLASLIATIARAASLPDGICAGQAWECEQQIPIETYQRAKTGALFAAAAVAGAAASGADGNAWRLFGERLGEAYQVADDIRDVACSEAEIGKPVGQDRAHGRPSVALTLGIDAAMERLEALASGAIAAIPSCPGAAMLRALILMEVRRLLPKELALRAA